MIGVFLLLIELGKECSLLFFEPIYFSERVLIFFLFPKNLSNNSIGDIFFVFLNIKMCDLTLFRLLFSIPKRVI